MGGGTFQLCAVSVLSEGVNVVQLHTDWKNSPIRYEIRPQITESAAVFAYCNQEKHML